MIFCRFVRFFLLNHVLVNAHISFFNSTHTSSSTESEDSSGATSRALAGYILEGLGHEHSLSTSATASSAPFALDNQTSTTYMATGVSTRALAAEVCTLGRCYTDVSYTSLPIAATGTGSAYASSCSKQSISFSDASSAWGSVHSSVIYVTETIGATSWSTVTYYSDASTLCDGHARATYSPAIPTSTQTLTTTASGTLTTETESVGWLFPVATPSCSINPSDCDALFAAYTSSMSRWSAGSTASEGSDAPAITAMPSVPPCENSTASASAASFYSSFYACGPCTIFGNGVQLLYFPVTTSTSRDMCVSAPTGSLGSVTHYSGSGGVEIVGGTGVNVTHTSTPTSEAHPETATYGNLTLSSGTAYIAIESVWAGDRCSAEIGSPVTSAVLAIPSESLLSLRYSQDHFQYFASSSSVTGYPFNFADLEQPIPYSAWVGQAQCPPPPYQNDGGCEVIYENQYKPQLAMPPGIRQLRPEWASCQMYYGGLYDPPLALQAATAVATPTVAWERGTSTSSASEGSSATQTLASATALPDFLGSSTLGAQGTSLSPTVISDSAAGGATTAVDSRTSAPASATQSAASSSGNNAGSSAATLTIGTSLVTVIQVAPTPASAANTAATTSAAAAVVVVGSNTLSAGGSALTLANDQVVTVASGGAVLVADVSSAVTMSLSTVSLNSLGASASSSVSGSTTAPSGSSGTGSATSQRPSTTAAASASASASGSGAGSGTTATPATATGGAGAPARGRAIAGVYGVLMAAALGGLLCL